MFFICIWPDLIEVILWNKNLAAWEIIFDSVL